MTTFYCGRHVLPASVWRCRCAACDAVLQVYCDRCHAEIDGGVLIPPEACAACASCGEFEPRCGRELLDAAPADPPARPRNDPAWARAFERDASPATKRAMDLRRRCREAYLLHEATPDDRALAARLPELLSHAVAAEDALPPIERWLYGEWAYATADDRARATVNLPPLGGARAN